MAINFEMQGSMSALNTGDLGKAITDLIANYLAGSVQTATVGLIDAVNADGTVNVKPLLNMPAIDGTQTEHAVIPDVEILFNENTVLSVKVAAGDIVLLVFCKESLNNFSHSGKTANTLLNQQFSAGNAFAVPLVFSSGTNTLQALMTEAYKTALETYLQAVQTLLIAIGAAVPAVSAALATFNAAYPLPPGFPPTLPPVNSYLTTKVKAS